MQSLTITRFWYFLLLSLLELHYCFHPWTHTRQQIWSLKLGNNDIISISFTLPFNGLQCGFCHGMQRMFMALILFLPSLQSLLSSMKQACQILTRDPEGGAARIPFETFSFLYSYLASIDGEISETEMKAFLEEIQEKA